ncbi:MAG TPA: hypothetical protein VKT26_00470 [Acetobacteraceae bacterium]|nr:hypothetical protein [Acetobacteraceae bacterium]
MSAASHAPAAPTDPDPARDAPPAPTAISRVLGVLRRLIDFGKQIAVTVQQRAVAPGFAFFAKPFGTADLATILARITNGLRLAAALEARLSHRADRGLDLVQTPSRMPSVRASQPERHDAPADTQPDPQPAPHPEDPRLARLPTEQEIAAAIRRRPIGAVIVDICRDLGLTPGQCDRAFWDELAHVIIAHGGNLATYFIRMNQRLFAITADALADPRPAWPAPPPSPALSTHPP